MPTCIGRAGGQFCYRRKNWSATPMILWCKEYITRKNDRQASKNDRFSIKIKYYS